MHDRLLPGHVSGPAHASWYAASLSLVAEVAGANSHYYGRLQPNDGIYFPIFQVAQSLLQRVRDDFAKGYLRDLRELIAGEVFSDFLEMAEYLLSEGYHIPAASIAEAVLEDCLRRLHLKHVGQWEGESSIGKLNMGLYKKEVYSKSQFKSVDSWSAIRNDADHGHFDKVDAGQVKLMVQGIRDFIAKHEG